MEKTRENFREYLRTLKGIQALGVIQDDPDNYHFVVNIFSRWYKKNKKIIPSEFEGIKVELRSVSKTSFLSGVLTFINDIYD